VIIWVIAGLLGVATGLRVGWAVVNKQSVVSAAMMLALGSLAFVAALNWEPVTLLVDTLMHWPNISIALSQIALTLCAGASCVMITTVGSGKRPVVMRRLAWLNYGIAAVIATISVVLFFVDGPQPEMAPREFLRRNLNEHTSLPWLLPLLYMLVALTIVVWAGMRYSNISRRGRALFVFSVGIGLLVLASGFFFLRAVGSTPIIGVGSAITLLATAMLIVATGSLLPSVEDWIGARREMRTIEPLLMELNARQPDAGVGVRPHGPLTFQLAEQMSLISDGLFLEATAAHAQARAGRLSPSDREKPEVSPTEQALAIARWIDDSGVEGTKSAGFPGLAWLRQPEGYSDREWILEIARHYRTLNGNGDRPRRAMGVRSATRSSEDAELRRVSD
jgi:hypothetical protein